MLVKNNNAKKVVDNRPAVILVKAKITPHLAMKIMSETGIKETEYDAEIVNEKFMKDAIEKKITGTSYHLDASLNTERFDTGNHVIDGNNVHCSIQALLEDLTLADYESYSIRIFRKKSSMSQKTDSMFIVEVVMKREKCFDNRLITSDQWIAFLKSVSKTFQHVHVWKNIESDSHTINLVNGSYKEPQHTLRMFSREQNNAKFLVHKMFPTSIQKKAPEQNPVVAK